MRLVSGIREWEQAT